MAQCWEIQTLTSTQKLVLLSLADQANDDGICWPSASTTAKRTGLFDRSVRRTIAELESLGLLSRKFQTGRPTFYKIHPCQKDTPVRKTPLSHGHTPLSEEAHTPVTGVNITVRNRKETSYSLSITISPDQIIPADIISKASEDACVSEKFAAGCVIGFKAHHDGKKFTDKQLTASLTKWIDREWRFKGAG